MSFFIRTAVIFTLVFNTSFVYADESQKPPQQNVDTTQNKTELKNFLEEFHHEIEHGEHDETRSKFVNVLSQWVDNFNLARISMDTHRWTQMKYYQDSGKSEYIRNFPVLASFYFLSHTLEVFSGPLGVYVASDLGLGNTAKVMIGSVGAIISVPGLDPLCILLFAVSPTKPMQKMFSGIRVVSVKLSSHLSNKFGLKQAAEKILSSKDRISEIVNSTPNAVDMVYDSEINSVQRKMVVKTEDGKPYLVLNFKSGEVHSGSQKTWVESVEVLDSEVLNQNKKSVESILSKFNLSVRYALKQAILKPRSTFYTDSITTEGNMTNIQFKDYSVVVKPKIRPKDVLQNGIAFCRRLFQ